MIIKCCITTPGKECKKPDVYRPNKEVYDLFGNLFFPEVKELYLEMDKITNEIDEIRHLSRKEKMEYAERCLHENNIRRSNGKKEDEPLITATNEKIRSIAYLLREDEELRKTDRLAVSLVYDYAKKETKLDVSRLDTITNRMFPYNTIKVTRCPTDLAILDREEKPLAFVSTTQGVILAYNLFVQNHFLPDATIKAHDRKICNLISSSDTLLSNDRMSLKMFDITTLKQVDEINRSTDMVEMNGNMIYYEKYNDIYMLDRRAPESQNIKVFTNTAKITSMTAEGSIVGIGTEDGEIFSSINGAPQKRVLAHNDRVNNLVTSGDRYIISAGDDGLVNLMDVKYEMIIHRNQTKLDDITVAIPPDTVFLYALPVDYNSISIVKIKNTELWEEDSHKL